MGFFGNRQRNTKKNILLRFFIYFDKQEQEFVGVCVDLGIIKAGTDPDQVEKDLDEAALGYIQNIVKDKDFNEDLLNQEPPKEYMDIYNEIIDVSQRRKIRTDNLDFNQARTFYKQESELCPAF